MPPQYIFQIEKLSKAHGKKEVLKDIWLSFYPGAKIGVLGGNGAGKSTLLRIMAGVDKDFIGTARPHPGTTIGYVPQEPMLDPSLDVRGNVETAVAKTRALLTRYDEINARLGEPLVPDEMEALLEEQGKVQDAIEHADAWDLDRRIEIAMDAMRLPPGDAEVSTLSGGERRRVALCKVLLERPDILLLDEPTNHLDAESVAWLERHLQEYPGTVVAVTHDRYFLDNVAGWILELDRGQGIPWQGNYTSWLEQKQERLAKEEKAESSRRKTLARELEWVRMAPRARVAKNRARIQRYEQMAAQEAERRDEGIVLQIPNGPHLGDLVVQAEEVKKAFGDNLLFENMTFRLPPGGIVGVIGPNGAGKTTLFRMVVGQENPDGGALRVGDTVVLSYVDQNRDALNPDNTIFQEVTGGVDQITLGKRKVPARAYVASFNFKGPDQEKKVGQLSGGERNRVHLAKLLKSGGNLLLLDEPTNDLDVDMLRALEEALLDFAGCAVVISHDRWFLDRIATHILAFEGDSKVVWCDGNYQTYETQRKERLGLEADQPHRIRYKSLTRNETLQDPPSEVPMATVTESAPEMTLADLIEKFGPIPIRRIRQEPAPGTATEDDVVAIADREDRLCELVDGILLEKAMGQPESELTFRLIAILGAFIHDRRLGIGMGPDGLMRLMPGLIRIPDIAFVSWERLCHRRPPKEQIASYGPELAVEVLSPSNTKKEMADKLRDYFATGTRLVWYIDPKAETITVYESPDRSTVLRGGDTLTGGNVLPGFEVPVAVLLTLPEPPAPPR